VNRSARRGVDGCGADSWTFEDQTGRPCARVRSARSLSAAWAARRTRSSCGDELNTRTPECGGSGTGRESGAACMNAPHPPPHAGSVAEGRCEGVHANRPYCRTDDGALALERIEDMAAFEPRAAIQVVNGGPLRPAWVSQRR